jgi:hypothetical protein
MKKIGASERIRITEGQLSRIIAAAQASVREGVCQIFDGESRPGWFEFSEILEKELLRTARIRLRREDEEIGNSSAIILKGRDIEKMVVLQDKIWREGISAGVPIDSVAEKMTRSTLRFLGVKIIDRTSAIKLRFVPPVRGQTCR